MLPILRRQFRLLTPSVTNSGKEAGWRVELLSSVKDSEARGRPRQQRRERQRIAGALVAALCLLGWLGGTWSRARENPADMAPLSSAVPSLKITGDAVWRWRTPEGDQVYGFDGACEVTTARGRHVGQRAIAVVRRDAKAGVQVGLYLQRDGRVAPLISRAQLSREPIFTAPLYRKAPDSIPAEVQQLVDLLDNKGDAGRRADQAVAQVAYAETAPPPGTLADINSVRTAQLEVVPPGSAQPLQPPTRTTPLPPAMPTDTPPPQSGSLGEGGLQFVVGGNQTVQFMPRGGGATPAQIQTVPLPQTGEMAVVVRGGATVLVRDVSAGMPDGSMLDLGTISISANAIVGWMPPLSGLLDGSNSLANADGELYMEGDIVFRQGDRVIYADRMYYNIKGRYGTILAAEAVTSVPEYAGYVRLKADVLQQIADGQYVAFGAAVTSSRMGVPRYWLQSEQVTFSDNDVNRVDPLTGMPYVDRVQTVSSRQNTVYLGGFPVFYWPAFSSDLKKTNLYLAGLKVKNDSVFGTQVMADFDLFQLFGVQNPPPGVDWILSTDYLSERGPAVGSRLSYSVPGMLGLPGPVVGFADAWVISDSGLDNLGLDRRALEPEEDIRGRFLMRHRHYLPYDVELIAEVGLLSDRNFLEQYFENEWDGEKDHDTSLRLRKYYLNNLFDLHADVRINEFYSETNRLPELEHYNVGSSWLNDWVNWSAYNRVGYAALDADNLPTNPAEQAKFTLLPGEVEREGLMASTRQELAVPLNVGPMKVVPFVSGEAAYWGEAADGEDLTRLLGQAGVRSSLPAWRLYPTVQSSLLNIRGLAHKVELQSELFYADASQNFEQLPLYDPLDDDAQEQFRRRFIFNTFGGALPIEFDPRTYAIRNGIQRYVTSPTTELAEDMLQTRLGFNQRFQTKRGLPGRERIVDLARFDVSTILFLEEERDNFGEVLGPTRYDFRYYAGDRVTLLSDGYFDFFEDGLRSVSIGAMSSRPGLGNVYLGVMSLEGPISSTVLRGTIDYRLNEKWITSAGTTFDLGDIGNVGQQLALTRIGESFLLQMGVSVDAGRDNVSFQFMLEPRFLPARRLGRLGGQLIPPPGIEGLE